MTIRIESRLGHDLRVPLNPERGNKSPTILIPAMKAGVPGVLDLEELDEATYSTLQWNYGRRPLDGNAKNTAEFDEHGNPRFHEIGLLKITLGKPGEPGPTHKAPTPIPLAGQSTEGLEPPRKAAPARKRKVA